MARLRLTLDIRFAPPSPAPAEDEFVLTLDELAGRVRARKGLATLLWGSRWEDVTVMREALPLSGVQAGALVIAALARARSFRVAPGAGRGRLSFLAYALAALTVALPRELVLSAVVYRHVRSVVRRATPAPRSPVIAPRRVTYLRPHPTLNWMGAYVGGAAAHTTGVINGLMANGLAVTVFAPGRPEGIGGARATTVPLRRPFHLLQWLTMTSFSEDIVDAALDSSPDFVYQRYTLGSYAGLELTRRLGVPLVLEFNGSEVWAIRNWGSGRLPLAETLVALEERNLADASLIVVVSDVLRTELISAGVDSDRILVNPNGVDVDALAAYRDRNPTEWRKFLARPEAPTIGFVGTFGLWHGVLELPAIAEAVARERPDARWVVIGSGRLFDQVRDEIKRRGLQDRVELTGIVPHERALELLASCDVCVSPHVPNPDGTRFFGSPTKLFEYMGLAKPIVASDLEQIGEVIEHERNGLLCPPGDPDAAAAAVVRLLGDEPLRERLAAGALESARTTYSWNAHVRRILDALAGERVE